MKKYSLFLFVILSSLFKTNISLAQLNQLYFQHYTTDDGLSQGSIYAIYQDSKGFIWFGTWDGLNRFDGHSFKVFKPNMNQANSMKGSRVSSILEDQEGNIWAGTYEALNKYNPRNNTFSQIYCLDESGKKIKDRYYPFYIDDKSELWFTYQVSKLASYNLRTKVITNYAFADNVMQNFTSPTQSRFQFYKPLESVVTAGNNGLRFLNMKTHQVKYYFSSHDQNRIGTQQLFWNCIINKKGICWIAGQNGLISLDTSTKTYKLYADKKDGFESTAFTAMAQDINGNLWCGADGNGLWVFDTSSKKFITHYKKELGVKNGLSENVITSLFFDKENNLWINSDPQGIDQTNLAFQQFHMLQSDSGPNTALNSVWSMCELDSDHLLVCFNQTGMMKYTFSTGTRQLYRLPKYFKETSVYHTILDQKGKIWMASDVGLFYSKDQLKSIQKINNQKFYYYVFLFEDQQRILCGTDKGLFSIPSDLSQTKFDTIHQFQHMNISCIGKGPNKEICVANTNNELILASFETNRYIIKSKFQFDFLIKSILCEHDSILWLGTNIGLVKLNLLSRKIKLWNEQNGLANNYVYGVLGDAKNRLWLSTNKGISEFDKQYERFLNHGLNEGLQGWEFNSRSYHQSKNGTIYFGGVNGLNYFNPDSFKHFDFNPSIQLLSVSINSKDQPLYKFELNKDPLQLSSRENNLTFQFTAVDYNRMKQINYFYKLHNSKDENWKSINHQGILNLVGLAPGKYHLQIIAQLGNYKLSSQHLNCYFIIKNPYYKTWWFIGLLVVSFLSIIYSLYKYRVSQIIKLATIKTSISQDLHDDIGSTLSSISMYTDVARRRALKQENITDLLEKINIVSKDLVSRMSDIVWSLNEKHGNLGQLKQRVEDYASTILTANEIAFTIELNKSLKDQKLNAKQLKNIFFIIKEAINNSLKYSNCSHIIILFELSGRLLKISVSDNGVGFNSNSPSKSLGGAGLKNMKARALILNGTCEINSTIGLGTRIDIRIPTE